MGPSVMLTGGLIPSRGPEIVPGADLYIAHAALSGVQTPSRWSSAVLLGVNTSFMTFSRQSAAGDFK